MASKSSAIVQDIRQFLLDRPRELGRLKATGTMSRQAVVTMISRILRVDDDGDTLRRRLHKRLSAVVGNSNANLVPFDSVPDVVSEIFNVTLGFEDMRSLRATLGLALRSASEPGPRPIADVEPTQQRPQTSTSLVEFETVQATHDELIPYLEMGRELYGERWKLNEKHRIIKNRARRCPRIGNRKLKQVRN